jgi:hypothetical protein
MSADAVRAAIQNAESVIQSRKTTREATQLEHRGALALEALADDVTRLHAEMQSIRVILMGMAVTRPR